MVRIFLTLLFAVAIAMPCQAQGKPNTLTPKEIADGWILLFDGETTFGWETNGDVAVKNGVLRVNGTRAEATARFTTQFDLFDLHFESNDPILTGTCLAFVEVSNPKSGTAYKLETPGGQAADIWVNHKLWLGSEDSRSIYMTSSARNTPKKEATKQARGPNDPGPYTIAFRSKGDLSIRNIKLKPREAKSFFNGKDLTGWNVFPGKKSKFAVIDNAINVKDGPGDLQTVGKYKDFVLQLEAISNGKHLNSGIFFRCRDGEYQNGYEAQIHNGFAETPKKYLLEEYDAKTNKLIGKKEAMYNAIDFGTGAIYRRVPARKQMSKDGEWFGMTVVAHGNHFATWVNGIQVTDWTDNRPKSDNARTGCKLEAGHISIQGHDPTTDLSFRNFRIAEFK